MWRGHLRKPRGNAWLLQGQMAQDIDEEFLFAGIVTVKGFLRGDAGLRQNGIGARPKISLLKKEPLGSGSDLFACLLYASVLPCLHINLISVSYCTVLL